MKRCQRGRLVKSLQQNGERLQIYVKKDQVGADPAARHRMGLRWYVAECDRKVAC
jgi:hypothetical protein